MNNTSVVVSVTLAVLAAIGIVVWGTSDHAKNDTHPQATTTQATSSEGDMSSVGEQDAWRDTMFAGIEFSYPPEAEVSAEAGRAKIQILGEGNEPNTEVTDGITGYLYTIDTVNGSLAETAQSLFADQSATADAVIASTTQETFAGRQGYSFELRNQLGSATKYFVLPTDQSGELLAVSYTASGPNAERFAEQFEAITQTVPMTGDTENSDDGTENNEGQAISNAQACQGAGGEWLAQYNECEIGDKQWCESQGGTFNSCASACRHDPDADVCTQQCVMVCSFSSAES